MELSKTSTTKNDLESKSKIQPIVKVASARPSKGVEPSLSRIPKRDSFNLSPPKENNAPSYRTKTAKLDKVENNKNYSSMINLRIPKTSSLASSGSNIIYSHRSEKSRDQTPRLGITERTLGTNQKVERVAVKRNLLLFDSAKDKLQKCQEHFMSKYEAVKNELPKEEGEFRLVTLVKNNEGQLLAKNYSGKIKAMCDQKTLEEQKVFLINFAKEKLNCFFNLDMIANSPREIGDTILKDRDLIKQIEEAKKRHKLDKQAFLEVFTKQMENFQACAKSKDPNSNKDLENKVQSYIDEVNELKTALETSKTECAATKQKLEQKLKFIKKELEEKTKSLLELKEFKTKYEFLEKECSSRKTYNAEVSEKLKIKISECEELNKKLKERAESNVKLEEKNKFLEIEREKAEIDLNAALKERQDRLHIEDSVGDQATTQIDELKQLETNLMNAKKDIENYQNEVQNLKNKIVQLEQVNMHFQEKNQKKDLENQTHCQTIRDLEDKLREHQNQVCASRNAQEKLTKLHEYDSSNNEKIQKLEEDLTKAQFHIKKLEDKIAMDGKLLNVRSCLIDSLQKKEQSQKVRLEDLFTEVGEKNNDLQMIKTEILTKTEEFQKLFSTLGTKQIELTRQEHMIKLLQESNERAQKLRVRQEAKIARLEEEIIELKQAISIYQDVVLPNNILRRNLAIAETSRGESDCSDSLGFYVEERRRKRHIDINVKKYEK